MKRIDPKWDGSYEPDCSSATIGIDRTLAITFVTAGLGAVGTEPNEPGLAIGGVVAAIGAIYAISAAVGTRTFDECQTARRRWAFSNAITARDPKRVASSPPSAPPIERRPRSTEPRPWVGAVSAAEQAAAVELHTAGNREFVQTHYEAALVSYKQAIQHWDHPSIRFNMAVCQIHLGDLVEARANLERALAYGAPALGATAHAQALTYRRELDDKLVSVTIDCPEPGEEVMLDGELVFTGPGVVNRFALPGEHTLVATKPGFLPASRKIVLVAGKPAAYEIRPFADPRPVP